MMSSRQDGLVTKKLSETQASSLIRSEVINPQMQPQEITENQNQLDLKAEGHLDESVMKCR